MNKMLKYTPLLLLPRVFCSKANSTRAFNDKANSTRALSDKANSTSIINLYQLKGLNNLDYEKLYIEKQKSYQDFCESKGFKPIPKVCTDFMDEISFISVMYDKPLNTQRRIFLRNKMIPYLEKANQEQAEFITKLLKYYDCI